MPDVLPEEDLVKVRANIVAAARTYVDAGYGQGYGLPVAGEKYEWGSNGALMSRAVVLGLGLRLHRRLELSATR